MDAQTQLLHQIELEWPTQIYNGLQQLIRENPDEEFYAAAFWIFYCDYTVIHPPTFGANAESLLEGETEEHPENRWCPPEWHWDVIDSVIDGMHPLYDKLSESMAGASKPAWGEIFAEHTAMIARICRTVTQSARSRTGKFSDLNLPTNFVLFAVDVRDEVVHNHYLRLSVDERILATLKGILADEGLW